VNSLYSPVVPVVGCVNFPMCCFPFCVSSRLFCECWFYYRSLAVAGGLGDGLKKSWSRGTGDCHADSESKDLLKLNYLLVDD
jgi:hypothetical protein